MELRQVRGKTNPHIQGYMAVSALILSLCIFILLNYFGTPGMTVNWLMGILIGVIMDRTRICFTAAFRDPILYGLSRGTQSVLMATLVSTIGFAILQYHFWGRTGELKGNLYPVGLNIFFGAFIFGVGASIAGSCASGTLMRFGEGFGLQGVVLVGIILGSIHGMHDAPWWYRNFSLQDRLGHIPSIVGWKMGVGINLLLVLALFGLVRWREWRQFKGGDE